MLLAGGFASTQIAKGLLKDLALRRDPMQRYRDKKFARGMSAWHDWIDWLGGYPFEVSKPEDVFEFFSQRGFMLEFLRTAGGGHGCNEYVFRRVDSAVG
jgi:2-polyprenyl-6-hydroxyphenyl methylase/3-demethylubiquinone-9 3-methyltransferase